MSLSSSSTKAGLKVDPIYNYFATCWMLAYFLKNTEIGKEKVKAFIQTLPKVLNPDAMSTYDMIVEEAVEELKEALAEEQQRAKTAILNLHRNFNIPLSEIALIFGKDLEYVEQVIAEEPV